VRWIGWLLLLLAAIGLVAAAIASGETPPTGGDDVAWRRTVDGWQRAGWLAAEIPLWRPALHPWVVGTLELLLSVAALAAFPQRAVEKRVGHT